MIISAVWAFYWSAVCMMPHSRHDVEIVDAHANYKKAQNADTIFCLNVDCWNILMGRWGASALKLVDDKNFIVGAGSQKTINSLLPHLRRIPFDHIRVPSQRMADYLLERRPETSVVVLRNGVNPDVYAPRRSPSEFVVGWVGKHREEKRIRLLKKLGHPVKMATGIPHGEMPAFYKSLSAYVCTSRTEGTPMPVLEAAASGLPVVSTRVGVVPELIEDEWIVSTHPSGEAARQITERLDILHADKALRQRVGERNRREILAHWTCEKRVRDWDRAFDGN